MNLTFLLRSCRLFSDLDATELAAVQAIAFRREYRKGQIIFAERETSRGFCVLAAGTVKIYRMRLGEHDTGLASKLKANGYARLVTELATLPARAIFSAFLPWPMLAA